MRPVIIMFNAAAPVLRPPCRDASATFDILHSFYYVATAKEKHAWKLIAIYYI